MSRWITKDLEQWSNAATRETKMRWAVATTADDIRSFREIALPMIPNITVAEARRLSRGVPWTMAVQFIVEPQHWWNALVGVSN